MLERNYKVVYNVRFIKVTTVFYIVYMRLKKRLWQTCYLYISHSLVESEKHVLENTRALPQGFVCREVSSKVNDGSPMAHANSIHI